MGIAFYPESRTFVLNGGGATYAMMIHPDYEILLHLYFGETINGDEASKLFFYDDVPRAQSPVPAGAVPMQGSLSTLPLEFSGFGVGDYRPVSAKVRTDSGFSAVHARYLSHRIFRGKPALEGLPASFASGDEAETLEITLFDEVINVEFILNYTIFEKLPVIARSCRAVNRSDKLVIIEKLSSFTIDYPQGDLDLISFHGSWCRERHFEREHLGHGIRQLASGRGLSSHQSNPFFIICDRDAGEENGRAWSGMFLYSGCFSAEFERDHYNSLRVQLGINPDNFAWRLAPGESFQTPEAVSGFSANGFESLSHTMHDFIRNHVIDQKWRSSHRPIVINNWEATRFNFTEEQIVDFARCAAKLGMEMLVLDDGWFGRRDSADSSLGDWFVYNKKLPSGLNNLVEKINSIGLKFGLWFEPEMVSPDSDLFRAHPDWCIHIPGRKSSLGRGQLVLDMGRQEVVDYLFERMSAILDSANIEYVKWDANRPITEAGSAELPPDRQGEVMHRFTLGTYSLLERLHKRYPKLLFEGCASGGGRFDAGMLYYTPQIWTSDDTDALERLYIQYGTSFGYPCSAMGAHISAVPNHQTGRLTSLRSRGDLALAGAFGYELDPNTFSEEDAVEVARAISERYADEALMLDGDYYRLGSPHTGNLAGWQFVAKDKSSFVATCMRILSIPNPARERFRMRGLDPEAIYVEATTKEEFTGAFLMNAGILLPVKKEDFTTFRYRFDVKK